MSSNQMVTKSIWDNWSSPKERANKSNIIKLGPPNRHPAETTWGSPLAKVSWNFWLCSRPRWSRTSPQEGFQIKGQTATDSMVSLSSLSLQQKRLGKPCWVTWDFLMEIPAEQSILHSTDDLRFLSHCRALLYHERNSSNLCWKLLTL